MSGYSGDETAKKPKTPRSIEEEIQAFLPSFLKQKMDAAGMTQAELATSIAKKYHIRLNQGTVSKYFSASTPDSVPARIPTFIVLELCSQLHLSLEDILEEIHHGLRLSSGTVPSANESSTESCNTASSEPDTNHSPLLSLASNNLFVSDPNDARLQYYFNTYYTYFTQTRSDNDSILEGELKITPGTNCINVQFTLKAPETESWANKTYAGIFVYCPNVDCCCCILHSTDCVGELSFIMFRYIPLNSHPLDCRLACSMTSAAGKEKDNFPTIHRMLLSRSQIRKEDWDDIRPLLSLNTSRILIKKKDLDEILAREEILKEILPRLCCKLEPEEYLKLRSTTVVSVGKLLSDYDADYTEAEVLLAISKLRSKAYSDRYNKISHKADHAVREILQSKNYYSDYTD